MKKALSRKPISQTSYIDWLTLLLFSLKLKALWKLDQKKKNVQHYREEKEKANLKENGLTNLILLNMHMFVYRNSKLSYIENNEWVSFFNWNRIVIVWHIYQKEEKSLVHLWVIKKLFTIMQNKHIYCNKGAFIRVCMNIESNPQTNVFLGYHPSLVWLRMISLKIQQW